MSDAPSPRGRVSPSQGKWRNKTSTKSWASSGTRSRRRSRRPTGAWRASTTRTSTPATRPPRSASSSSRRRTRSSPTRRSGRSTTASASTPTSWPTPPRAEPLRAAARAAACPSTSPASTGAMSTPPPRPMPKKGADIEMPLALSFEEAVTGLTTNITVNRSEQCSRCNGAGDTGGNPVTCPTCHGSGQVQRAGGRLRFAQECPDCGGAGKRRPPCALCNGKGTVPKTESVKVRIPAGVDTGSRVRIPAKGEGGRLGAPPGDLYIITNVGRHPHFTRKGDNIYVTIPVTVPEAALGAKIEVPTVEGKSQLRIPPGTQSGQKFRLRDRGAPSLRNPGAKGHQFVEVQVTLPKVISEETKELLRQYSKLNSTNPRVEMG